MSNPSHLQARLSVDEYLSAEEQAEIRHEYVAGLTYAMAGSTVRHNKVALNIVAQLHLAARSPCEVFANDVRVQAARDVFNYPDVVVICEGFADKDVAVRSPCLLVEVTSPLTARVEFPPAEEFILSQTSRTPS